MNILPKWLSGLIVKVMTKKAEVDSEPKIISKKIAMSYMQMLERAYTELAILKEVEISQYVKMRSAEIIEEMKDEDRKSIKEIKTAITNITTIRRVEGEIKYIKREIEDDD